MIYSCFREIFREFFENFFENVKLVIKLLCLSKRQPKYQRVEINIRIILRYLVTLDVAIVIGIGEHR
jgi:hypothetical protein